ncbi:MAG TPA: HNH endonuclease [Actinomycetota bacterium]|jgi:5-methylcytosine-specific restriction endonuclease McrA
MGMTYVDDAIELLEKSNADLEPELLTADDARRLLASYARAEKLAAFGIAALARKIRDSATVARATGSSIGKAEAVVRTGEVLAQSPALSAAMQAGSVSLDQAAEIAKAEESAPGAVTVLLPVAHDEAFHVLRDKARKVRLEAEQHRDLARRQRDARAARSYADELGMVHVHLALEPHVGAPIVARAETEAQRLARTAKGGGSRGDGATEPFERHLADAYAALLAGSGKARARRPELVVVVSHEVAKRGWSDVRDGEVCKIPGIGPVSPEVAAEIAEDAFLTGVIYDGKDLRQIKRWSRSIPVEVAIALELGDPPGFDGIACVDCGNRFRTEIDHVRPRSAGGATAHRNLKPRCWSCHRAKTKRERAAARAGPGGT